MLNLFGCSNWDFFICFFELNLRTNDKTNSTFSRFSIGLLTLGGQLVKEIAKLRVNFILWHHSQKVIPGCLKCCACKKFKVGEGPD